MIPKNILNNQGLQAHALFFDDPHKELVRETDAEGRPNGRFVDIPKGVEVLENGDVKFAYHAPDASSVSVSGLGGSFPAEPRYPLEKGEDGWWRGTVSGLTSGIFFADFFVDGTRALNPYMPYCYGCDRAVNFFELPDKYSSFCLLQDVPHGNVRMDYYYSSFMECWQSSYVYTPPGYNKNREKRYPVLYLLHGAGESESAWMWQGRVPWIMDNLIADGQCEEMIVVTNCGVTYPPGEWDGSNPFAPKVEELLARDCIPFIDGKYRTLSDRNHRAVAGLSMGGAQALNAIIAHPEIFASTGIFSAAPGIRPDRPDTEGLLSDPAVFNDRVDLFFVASGEYEDMEPRLRGQTRDMLKKGFRVVYYETPGYHEWGVWRYCLTEFAKRLFRR